MLLKLEAPRVFANHSQAMRQAGFLVLLSNSSLAFLLNLAKVWAGLPTPSGRSYYHGVAGNRAVLSYDSYTNAVDEILGG